MSKQDDVFLLIKAMNKSEKKVFRLQSTQQGNDKTYMQVFDLLDKQKEFDSHKLKMRFKGKKINLSHEKAYLENNIFRALRNCYSENSELIRLKNTILNIELLYQKRLNEQALKLVDRTILDAKKYEFYNQIDELIEWQYRLYSRTGNFSKLANYENEGLKEKESAIDFLQRRAQIEKISFKTTSIIQTKGFSVNKTEKEELEKCYETSQKLFVENKNSFSLSELCLMNLYLSAAYLGKHVQALSHCKQILALYEKHPQFISLNLSRYLIMITSTANRFYDLGKYDDTLRMLTKIESFWKQLRNLQQKELHDEMFNFVCHTRIMIHIAQKEFAKAVNEAEKFERDWDYKKSGKRNKWMIKIQIARAHFFNGNYKAALEDIYSFINNSDFGAVKRDVVEHAYLMRLIIYYELQLFPLLENQCRSALRFFDKQGEDEFSRKLINGIWRLSNVQGDKPKMKKIVSELAKALEKIPSRLSEKKDFTQWLESKLK